ncbi:MAG: helix-turn-helix transcriptional regulator [Rhodothermales bacterium]
MIEIRRLLQKRFSREVVAVKPSEASVTSADAAFLERVRVAVEAHMANGNFGAAWLADEVGLSERQLRRKLKELTNLSTAGYIRSMRLQRAAQLLEEQAGTVSEVAYAVGFQDPKHFSRLFRQVFGVSPSRIHALNGT